MGRYYWDKKGVVEDCTVLSIAKLKEFGFLAGDCSGNMRWTRKSTGTSNSIGIHVNTSDEAMSIRLVYTITDRQSGQKTNFDYTLPLVATACHFGGVRYWFICGLALNGRYCGRRVGKLYLPPGGRYFGCRHCYDLSYESRNESRRGYVAQLGKVLEINRRIEDLRKTMKRTHYAGKPTRKFERWLELDERMAERAQHAHQMAKARGLDWPV